MSNTQKKSNEPKPHPLQKAFEGIQNDLSNPKAIQDHILGELDLLYFEISISESCELSPRAIAAMKRRVIFIINLIDNTPNE